MNKQQQKTKTYYFRGQIEVVRNGQYKWTETECLKAVFVELQS